MKITLCIVDVQVSHLAVLDTSRFILHQWQYMQDWPNRLTDGGGEYFKGHAVKKENEGVNVLKGALKNLI